MGNVYVADSNNQTIRKITPAGQVTTLVGSPGSKGFSGGELPGLTFSPNRLAVSGTTLYFSSGDANAIFRVVNLP